MVTYPVIDSTLLTLGPVSIHWYGMMYVVGFLGGWWLGRRRVGKPGMVWDAKQVDDIVFYIVLGVILGGRIGYILFYNFSEFLANPLVLVKVWNGGMSFHGGLLGVLLAVWYFASKHGRTFYEATDFIAPLVTIGLGAGRIGNFINAELWGGVVTDLPWGMRVPCSVGEGLCARLGLPLDAEYSLPVHPSQLYESFLEGLVLFLILWTFSAKPRPRMAVSGLFLVCYGIFRFLVEFVRMPDQHLGYLAFDWLTMGQLLSLPMIVFGALLLFLAYRPRIGQG